MRGPHNRPVFRSFPLVALALICPAVSNGSQATSEATGSNWYGAAIGDPVPTDRNGPDDYVWPSGAPAPWTESDITTDDDHRISEISLADVPPILIDAPRRPGSASPPTPPSVIRGYYEVGTAARAYAIARLGPPRDVAETRYEGELTWASLRWDFVEAFVKCESGKPVYAATSTEPTGLIAEATLAYGPDGVTLDIKGKKRELRSETVDRAIHRTLQAQAARGRCGRQDRSGDSRDVQDEPRPVHFSRPGPDGCTGPGSNRGSDAMPEALERDALLQGQEDAAPARYADKLTKLRQSESSTQPFGQRPLPTRHLPLPEPLAM